MYAYEMSYKSQFYLVILIHNYCKSPNTFNNNYK
jgi:hypothetical protein